MRMMPMYAYYDPCRAEAGVGCMTGSVGTVQPYYMLIFRLTCQSSPTAHRRSTSVTSLPRRTPQLLENCLALSVMTLRSGPYGTSRLGL